MTGVAILGVPHDGNSSFLQGSAEAPASIRDVLRSDAYSNWTETGIDLAADGRLVDLGDVAFDGEADPWTVIEGQVDRALAGGKPLVCLGGDHAITWPIMRALRRHHAPITVVQIDAHPDLYDAYQGNPRSHTSSFARIMEEGLADRLIQVGIRNLNDHHREQARRFGVEIIEARDCGLTIELDIATPVYVSMDIDGLDPAYAPGVAHREPGGLATRQVIGLIHALRQPIVGADVVEFNPRCDPSGITAVTAAKIVKEIAGQMIVSHRP